MQEGPQPQDEAISSSLPMELWVQIASALDDDKALARLMLVCKQTAQLAHFDELWQPFLNRLKNLDSTVPTTRPSDAPPLWAHTAFKQHFARINTHQRQQLASGSLVEYFNPLQVSLEKMRQNVTCLAALEDRHQLLQIAQKRHKSEKFNNRLQFAKNSFSGNEKKISDYFEPDEKNKDLEPKQKRPR